MNRFVFLTATMFLFIACIGCTKSTRPVSKTPKVVQADPSWTSIGLHIDGFKKSKSGAT